MRTIRRWWCWLVGHIPVEGQAFATVRIDGGPWRTIEQPCPSVCDRCDAILGPIRIEPTGQIETLLDNYVVVR